MVDGGLVCFGCVGARGAPGYNFGLIEVSIGINWPFTNSVCAGQCATRWSMEARSGGGDRYAASMYLGPSSGGVHGKSSIELFPVCGELCMVGLSLS